MQTHAYAKESDAVFNLNFMSVLHNRGTCHQPLPLMMTSSAPPSHDPICLFTHTSQSGSVHARIPRQHIPNYVWVLVAWQGVRILVAILWCS